jgi:hypothetical protein
VNNIATHIDEVGFINVYVGSVVPVDQIIAYLPVFRAIFCIYPFFLVVVYLTAIDLESIYIVHADGLVGCFQSPVIVMVHMAMAYMNVGRVHKDNAPILGIGHFTIFNADVAGIAGIYAKCGAMGDHQSPDPDPVTADFNQGTYLRVVSVDHHLFILMIHDGKGTRKLRVYANPDGVPVKSLPHPDGIPIACLVNGLLKGLVAV